MSSRAALVITVANPTQAAAARALVEAWRRRGRFGSHPVEIVEDPRGRRAGSGGSTLLVLHRLALQARRRRPEARSLEALFAGQHAFILHSGGDSRRLPGGAGLGKAWLPLPLLADDGGFRTVLELALADLERLGAPPTGQVLVAAGDMVMDLPAASLRAGPGVTAIAAAGPVETATRHGAFVLRPGSGARHVEAFLQKADPASLRAAGAVDRRGHVLLDTGIMALSPRACAALLRAGGWRGPDRPPGAGSLLHALERGRADAIDLYQHVPDALLDRPGALPALRRALRGVPFHACVARGADFMHLGTSREWLERLHDPASRRRYRLAEPRAGVVAWGSRLERPLRARGPVLVEGCHAPRGLVLGGRNVITGVPEGALPRTGPAPRLPAGACLAMLPLRGGGWCAIAFHVDDDLKCPAEAGGTLGGRPLSALPARTGVTAAKLFSPGGRSAWHARVWPVAAPRRALELVRWIHAGGPAPAAWRRARRLSLAQAMTRVDVAALVAARLRAEARQALALAGRAEGAGGDPLRIARWLAAAGRDAAALQAVGAAVEAQPVWPEPARRAGVVHDQGVWASAPVRVDLAGGWSDTPPICTELGGAVVNVAIRLAGADPVHAMARLSERPEITIHSVDAARSVVLRSTRELLDHRDPRHWSALPRAALVLSGLVPRDPRVPLRPHLERLGGGISLSLWSAVPKGSGLGTSSILGAVTLAALHRLRGRAPDPGALVEEVSVLEQLISTRGGWQDQVGGVHPGFKLATTRPGARQRPLVAPIAPPAGFVEEFERRSVLLFTGIQRMARGILEHVVLRALRRESLPQGGSIPECLRRTRDNAFALREALQEGDFRRTAASLRLGWELKRTLDPRSATAAMDAWMEPVARHLAAWHLPGAGGGGFIVMLANDPRAAERIRSHFRRHPPAPRARLFDWEVARSGLRIAVL